MRRVKIRFCEKTEKPLRLIVCQDMRRWSFAFSSFDRKLQITFNADQSNMGDRKRVVVSNLICVNYFINQLLNLTKGIGNSFDCFGRVHADILSIFK